MLYFTWFPSHQLPSPLQEGGETSKFICLRSWRPCLQPFRLYNQDWEILSSKGLPQSEVVGGRGVVLSWNLIFFPNPNFLKSWYSSPKIPSHSPFPHMILFYLNQCCGSVSFWYGFGSVSWNNGSGSCSESDLISRIYQVLFFLLFFLFQIYFSKKLSVLLFMW